jgi:hypothetical protein
MSCAIKVGALNWPFANGPPQYANGQQPYPNAIPYANAMHTFSGHYGVQQLYPPQPYLNNLNAVDKFGKRGENLEKIQIEIHDELHTRTRTRTHARTHARTHTPHDQKHRLRHRHSTQ